MHVIHARNVSAALPQGLAFLSSCGIWEETRAGRALVSPVPVVTAYTKPRERVLLSPIRDANPFFHLAEALWMLQGRADSKFLDNFIRDFGSRFAEPGGDVHGAYGRRWRGHFQQSQKGFSGTWGLRVLDQLASVARELKDNPGSRQVVLTMWDPGADLGIAGLKDRPCNTHIYFRLRDEAYQNPPVTDQNSAEHEARIARGEHMVLDMTVLCRSNDIVMGAYGANAVHFSVLQEYLASKIGVRVGTYYQVSNNFHAYERDLNLLAKRNHDSGSHYAVEDELKDLSYEERRVSPHRLVDNPATFDGELLWLMDAYEAVLGQDTADESIHSHAEDLGNGFLAHTVWPMLMAHRFYRREQYDPAFQWADRIEAKDWGRASVEWLRRREFMSQHKKEKLA
jgi:thymidylate synthase